MPTNAGDGTSRNVAAEAQWKGVQVVIASADNDSRQQVGQVDDLLTQRVGALICTPQDSTAAATGVRAANQANVPVRPVRGSRCAEHRRRVAGPCGDGSTTPQQDVDQSPDLAFRPGRHAEGACDAGRVEPTKGSAVSESMRAFVIKQVGRAAVVDKPIPEPGPEEAVVRTTAALICTSDLHTVKGALPVEPDRTPGHESVGVIHELGSAVTGFRKGRRVAVCTVTPCHRCSYCQRGFTSQCGGPLGGYRYTMQMDGTMADAQAVHTCDVLTTGFLGAEHAPSQPLRSSSRLAAGEDQGRPATHPRPAATRPHSDGAVVAVVGVPDRRRQERACAVIVLTNGAKGFTMEP